MKRKIMVPIGTTFFDYPDNSSLSTIIYFLGCDHDCKLCHNPELRNVDHPLGFECDIDILRDCLKDKCNRTRTKNVVFSGGDPLHKNNLEFVKKFLVKYGKEFNVCIYTGYSISVVKEFGLINFQYIKTGKYDDSMKIDAKKTDEYFQLASTNQAIYDNNFNCLSVKGRMEFR
jgi:anaerobic ribonucleoside-triphosphate reductase activating protein